MNLGPFYLRHDTARRLAREAVDKAPDGHVVRITEPSRTKAQNDKLHAMLADIVAARVLWDGEEQDIDFWKGLAVSGWAIAEKAEGQVTRGWEGEIALIRKSTTKMNKAELSSLIEYVTAWCVKRGIQLKDGQ